MSKQPNHSLEQHNPDREPFIQRSCGCNISFSLAEYWLNIHTHTHHCTAASLPPGGVVIVARSRLQALSTTTLYPLMEARAIRYLTTEGSAYFQQHLLSHGPESINNQSTRRRVPIRYGKCRCTKTMAFSLITVEHFGILMFYDRRPGKMRLL